MLINYLFFIGFRYFKVKRKDHFISFISTVSIIGIALGVAVLITVLSIMNGFSKEIRSKILSITPHIILKNYGHSLDRWQVIVENLKKIKKIIGVAPYISGQGLIIFNGYSKPVITIGIDIKQIANVYPLSKNLIYGSMSQIESNRFGILVGKDLAESIGLHLGDPVVLMIPQANISPVGFSPKIKKLTIVGIFQTNTPYDQNHIFLNIKDASKLYNMKENISGIQIKVSDELVSNEIASQINSIFDYRYIVSDWSAEYGAFLQAIQTEKIVMWCILLLIISVAGFNLISSLIMLVTDKKKDIAILRVMGASYKDVVLIFMIQGVIIGIIGTLIGVVIGLFLAYNITELVNFLQGLFKIKFISEEVYWIGFVPSKILLKDVLYVCILSLLMSFLATLYPSYRASNIKPAEALRYE